MSDERTELTRREQFAMAALVGVMQVQRVNVDAMKKAMPAAEFDALYEQIEAQQILMASKAAVAQADALIAALDGESTD